MISVITNNSNIKVISYQTFMAIITHFDLKGGFEDGTCKNKTVDVKTSLKSSRVAFKKLRSIRIPIALRMSRPLRLKVEVYCMRIS